MAEVGFVILLCARIRMRWSFVRVYEFTGLMMGCIRGLVMELGRFFGGL